jgi:hypothetical protein
MSKKYILEVFDDIYSWEGNPYDKTERICLLRKLQPGNIVRVMFLSLRKNSCFVKVYLEIISIDRYQYGGIENPRKFTGKCLDIYNPLHNETIESEFGIKYGQLIDFNPHNIDEIPIYHNRIWTTDTNNIVQGNYDKIKQYLLNMEMNEIEMENNEYEKRYQRSLDLSKLIKELKNIHGLTNNECKMLICKYYKINSIDKIPVNWSNIQIKNFFTISIPQ